MARRNSKSSTNTQTTEATTEAPEINEEAPMTETVAEESTTTEAEAEVTEKQAPKEADLTAFGAAVESAVEESDETTGHIPEQPLAAVTEEYRKINGIKGKNAAKALVNEGLKKSMDADDLRRARAYLMLGEEALVTASAAKGERTPTDPTEAFVQAVATLNLGYSLRVSQVPEGVSDDWQDKATALVNELNGKASEYLAWTQADPETRGEAPEVNAVVKNAVKLATGKTAKAGKGTKASTGEGFSGERGDIAKHIVAAFADKPVGTFMKIAEICNTTTDEYSDRNPSAGAVSGRLFPDSGKESVMVKFGIQPDTRDGKKGAVKVADHTEDSDES